LFEARRPSVRSGDLCFKDSGEAGVTRECTLLSEARITATLRLSLLFSKHARAHSAGRSVLLHQLCVTTASVSSTIAVIVASSEPRRAESSLPSVSCGLYLRSSRVGVGHVRLRCARRRREKAAVRSLRRPGIVRVWSMPRRRDADRQSGWLAVRVVVVGARAAALTAVHLIPSCCH